MVLPKDMKVSSKKMTLIQGMCPEWTKDPHVGFPSSTGLNRTMIPSDGFILGQQLPQKRRPERCAELMLASRCWMLNPAESWTVVSRLVNSNSAILLISSDSSEVGEESQVDSGKSVQFSQIHWTETADRGLPWKTSSRVSSEPRSTSMPRSLGRSKGRKMGKQMCHGENVDLTWFSMI
jgi:hypothetical protein